ncbi:MAG: hypothetical protein LBF83_00820 [Spirochaetaceae bacterium]|jgi:hypothetical protein|nr:hypothetical protein [Spirochaetaceae bacterium]
MMPEHSTYKFLEDVDELKWFWTYAMRPLKPHEVYFISTSARNKRLNDAEREYFNVGRSEMWHKEIITGDDYARFLKGIRRCETNRLAYLTKGGIPYPDKVLVLYTNIAPVDAYSAMTKQIDSLIAAQRELVDSVLKNSRQGIEQAYWNIRHSHTTGQSVFARSFSDSEWVDIDSDIEGYDNESGRKAIEGIRDFLCAEPGKGNFMQIGTEGGFHWLVRKSKLSDIGRKYKADPLAVIIQFMRSAFAANGITVNEIIKNKNEMIPLPGTIQYGCNTVRVLNKDDFTEDLRLHDWPDYVEFQPSP